MTEVVAYKKEHMQELLKDENNKFLVGTVTEAIMVANESAHAFTVLEKSTGKVLACGGVAEYWPGRGECWATFSGDWKRYKKSIHRVAKTVMDLYPGRRIEASIMIGFEDGHRWIKALGFKLDAPLLKAYLPDGGDVSLYSRVK